ncbi:GNAT family N-acetyltransferase [Paenibacillus lycopersici]|uniref:GNAT family N-acetyltransferase n=1 Tax=Paenibacillus lycopersici TaxID=2704462 RepID=A0A6C0G778_9BACL|nr:GNAT family N-acetyltransferase [Paenibacillus lycopersici]QHT63185.1 GNAT family N-acetyltransferase [Paenibacillus lycopersici]
MVQVTYRKLVLDDCDRIKEMNPSQFIERAWREVDGVRRLVDIHYLDPDWPEGYESHFNRLRATVANEGEAAGAFDADGRLIGFAAVNREPFGGQHAYVLLDQLFVSLERRNQGIGKRLFASAADIARAWQADKLYICAGSAEETIAFYRAIGCTEAAELNQALYDNDPRDYQLEFQL